MLSVAAICCMSVAAVACLLHVFCASQHWLRVARVAQTSGDRMLFAAAICCSCCMSDAPVSSVACVASVACYLLQLETEETGAQN